MHGKEEILGKFSVKREHLKEVIISRIYVALFTLQSIFTNVPESPEKVVKIRLFPLYKQEADAQRD